MKTEVMSWEQFDKACLDLLKQMQNSSLIANSIYGVPRGGLCLAVNLSHLLKIPLITSKSKITKNTLIVDDIIDTGKTLEDYIQKNYQTATLYYKSHSKYKPNFYALTTNRWIIFPWEKT